MRIEKKSKMKGKIITLSVDDTFELNLVTVVLFFSISSVAYP